MHYSTSCIVHPTKLCTLFLPQCKVLGDPCLATKCDYFGKCVHFNNGTTKCVCETECPEDYSPVCASDGKTYENNCRMKAESCRVMQAIGVSKLGICAGKGTYQTVCTQDLGMPGNLA